MRGVVRVDEILQHSDVAQGVFVCEILEHFGLQRSVVPLTDGRLDVQIVVV